MTQPRAGWYPDPADPSRQRYFDGTTWTENYAPYGAPPAVGNGQPVKPGMSRNLKIGLGVLAGFLALIVVGSLGDNDKTNTSSSGSETTSRAAVAAPTPSRTATAAPTPTEPPKPDFTPSQENAIAKAESYLDFSAFSKQGLIEQLEYSQFSSADATFAVEYIEGSGGVDWNEQAVKKAKSYMDFSAFSQQGLIEQLEYSGFTPSQAQHGASIAYGG